MRLRTCLTSESWVSALLGRLLLLFYEFQMSRDRTDEIGFRGIHGLPFDSWNGVGQVPGGNDLAGFCPHNVRDNCITTTGARLIYNSMQGLLFGLWHRPYVALYEVSDH